MKVFTRCKFLMWLVLFIGGCQDHQSATTTTTADTQADIRLQLARLGPDEQRIAEQQKYCPMMEGVQLGEMGRPYKVTVNGISAFVCCENCARIAHEDPDHALARIRVLKENRAKELVPLNP